VKKEAFQGWWNSGWKQDYADSDRQATCGCEDAVLIKLCTARHMCFAAAQWRSTHVFDHAPHM
jgi:hypothetical protein